MANELVKERSKNERPNERTRLSEQTLEETVDKDPDFVYYLLEESDEKIAAHEKSGWVLDRTEGAEDSTDPRAGIKRVLINRSPDAPFKHGVWIKKRKDWFDEDEAANKLKRDEKDAYYDPTHPLNAKRMGASDGEMRNVSIKQKF